MYSYWPPMCQVHAPPTLQGPHKYVYSPPTDDKILFPIKVLIIGILVQVMCSENYVCSYSNMHHTHTVRLGSNLKIQSSTILTWFPMDTHMHVCRSACATQRLHICTVTVDAPTVVPQTGSNIMEACTLYTHMHIRTQPPINIQNTLAIVISKNAVQNWSPQFTSREKTLTTGAFNLNRLQHIKGSHGSCHALHYTINKPVTR